MSTLKFGINAEILGQSVYLEGEAHSPQQVRDVLRELLGHDKEAKAQPTVVQEVPAALVEVSQPVRLSASSLESLARGVKQAQEGQLKSLGSFAEPAVVYPTIDDVADQVKALVAKQGLPKTALLLQEFGAARAKDVAEEKRAGFIAKAKEVLA